MGEGRSPAFYWLAAFFAAFVLFLYGPMIVIFILSFQGPNGGLTFPLNGLSLHWFERLMHGGGIVDINDAFQRSLELGLVVMILTVLLSLSAGLAFRKRFAGSNLLFFVAVASLIVPSIVTSLGIALEFRLLDDFLKNHGPAWITDNLKTTHGAVHLRSWRASHLDAALRAFGHVRDLQSLRQSLRRGGARPRRDAVADAALRHPAHHSALGDRRRAVRLHALMG